MLYMNILTWDPVKRDEVIERSKKIGFDHAGMKTIGTWVEAVGGRCFQLVDIPREIDPALSLKANYTWNDILKIESIPVIDAAEMLKIFENLK